MEDVLQSIVPPGETVELEASGAGSQLRPQRGDILHVFEACDRSVLILGARGSGKTTTLLDLASKLVHRAESDPTEPVPVVFNLASWGTDRLPIAEWMARQLTEYYRVPRRLARLWISRRRLAPLLDGLDEVDADRQNACIEALNAFISAGIPGLAVCCNDGVYRSIGTSLHVNAGFRLEPLTTQQIEDYLRYASDDLEALREAFADDPELLELARTPLMLHVMTAAYSGLSDEDLAREDITSAADRRTHVFETYVFRALAEVRDGATQHLDEDTVIGGLAWLARRMKQNGQPVFLIERLQPTWLEKRRLRSLYIAASRLAGGLTLGLSLGVLIVLGVIVVGGGFRPRATDVLAQLGLGLTFGVMGGLAAAVIDHLRLMVASPRPAHARQSILFYAIAFGVMGAATAGVVASADSAVHGAAFGIFWGVVFWMFFGSPRGRTGLHNDIAMVEALRFLPREARSAAARGALIGGIICGGLELLVGLAEALDPVTRLITVVIVAGIGSVAGAVVGGVLGGLQRAYVETRRRPNEGIRMSLRNMLLGSAAVTSAAAVLLVPLFILMIGGWGAAAGLAGAFFAGLLAALWYGGMDLIQHYLLRGMLMASSAMPRPFIPFLECAVEMSILQRVGGGYHFLNDFLLSRFSMMGEDAAPQTVEPSGAALEAAH